MRRGYTIIELLTATTLLMSVLGLVLPMFFMGDRALTVNATNLTRQAAAARLLMDLSRDLRQSPANAAAYSYDATTDTTTHSASTGETSYPGCRFTLTSEGSLTRLTVRAGAVVLSTSVWCRSR